jgi:hypothetical protein
VIAVTDGLVAATGPVLVRVIRMGVAGFGHCSSTLVKKLPTWMLAVGSEPKDSCVDGPIGDPEARNHAVTPKLRTTACRC